MLLLRGGVEGREATTRCPLTGGSCKCDCSLTGDRQHTTCTHRNTQHSQQHTLAGPVWHAMVAAAPLPLPLALAKLRSSLLPPPVRVLRSVASRKCCNVRPTLPPHVAAVTQRINHKIIASFARRIH